jgi:hypothetical protein
VKSAFYRYKVRIHVLDDRAMIAKCFTFHHPTPVAARVIDRKIGLFSLRALDQASSHQAHQSIGFSACFRKKGLWD